MLDFDKVNQQIELGYINCQHHQEADLMIFNYTSKAQFDWFWTPETRACRGLITDSEYNIIARPFEKFFSYEQLEGKVPDEPFEVYEKMDGSLGILYWVGDVPYIATRGSFTSEQALRATKILREKYSHIQFDRSKTYLFEIIFPENRIVVNYRELEELILLAVIDTATGIEDKIDDYDRFGLPMAGHVAHDGSFSDLFKYQIHNREGFVVRFQSGFRVKIKFIEYKRLHKLLTGINHRHIWETLKGGKDWIDLIDRVPDEFYNWIQSVVTDLWDRYHAIESTAHSEFWPIENKYSSRREHAEQIKKCSHPDVMFNILDKKSYSQTIWKKLKPSSSKSFRCDSDT